MISREHQAAGYLVVLVTFSLGGLYLAVHELARGGPAFSLLEFSVIGCGYGLWAIGSGLEEVVPLAGLAAIGLVGYSIYSWWQTRQAEASTPETSVEFDLGGQNGD